MFRFDPSILFSGIYPNPGRTDFKIRLTAPHEINVAVSLYDVSGRMVSELFNGRITGSCEIPLVSNGMPSGVYFVRITTDGETITEKVVLLR
jgi:hypothetical protein